MRFLSPLLILVALLAAACGGAAVFPEVFSQERADGKIPVSIELIRKQTQKEIDGMPEKQATAERWRDIEADYNDCRVSSARKTKAEADKIFADCMSRKGYVYMLRLDAEQLHDEIAAAEPAKYAAEKKAAEEARLVAKKKAEERRVAAEKRRKEEKAAAERRRKIEKAAAKKKAEQDNKDSNLIGWVRDDDIAQVRAWLADGANPNAVDNGTTALMWAAYKGNSQIVKALLAAGASVNATDNNGFTALMNSAVKGQSEVAKALLAAGANMNMTAHEGKTALIMAAHMGHLAFVKVLLAAGANPNVAKHSGWTALMMAAYYSHPDVAKILLDCGASPTQKTNKGYSAYDFAEDKPAVRGIFYDYYIATQSGRRVSSCKGRWSLHVKPSIGGSVATAPPPSETNVAEAVFENVWQSIVVIRQGEKQGSGVIVRPNVVATNCHVVDSYGKIIIYQHDNRRATTDTTFNAVIRHRDDNRDFCLLGVVGLQGKPAKVRRYDTLNIGEDVYAVGSPKGLDLSLSSGIISQLRQGTITRYIQTDAAISPGSSGGGLFDSDGNLIGILTHKIADEKAEGLGFAIPADLVLQF